MKIETKFNVGDEVWLYRNHRILSGIIYCFSIDKYKNEKVTISYGITGKFEDYNSVPEEDIFKNREDAEERYNQIKWEKEYNRMKEQCINEAIEKFEKEWESKE